MVFSPPASSFQRVLKVWLFIQSSKFKTKLNFLHLWPEPYKPNRTSRRFLQGDGWANFFSRLAQEGRQNTNVVPVSGCEFTVQSRMYASKPGRTYARPRTV